MNKSLAIKILLIVFICGSIYKLVDASNQLIDKENQRELLQIQIKEQKITNGELKDMITGGVDEEYLERLAREKLGLVYSNERIFVNPEGKTK